METGVTVRVFDPAMCCSTGVCGPDVDQDLVRFAADLAWLDGEGVRVERFSLSRQPGAFASDQLARRVLQESGEAGLPLIVVDGVVKSSGAYPTRERLAEWAGKRAAALPVRDAPSACCTSGGVGSDGSGASSSCC